MSSGIPINSRIPIHGMVVIITSAVYVVLIDWIYWKLGDKIADDYMIPYNQKIFNKELNELGTYWLEKLPNVSCFPQLL